MTLHTLIDRFDVLMDAPAGVSKLRQFILQLAVQGKLTEQDQSDEPAEELLERIKTKKQRLYDEGEIRKPKSGSPISVADIPFGLPENWQWVRLVKITFKITDGTHSSPKIQHANPGSDRYLYLTSKNLNPDGLDLSDVTYVDAEIHRKIYDRCDPEKGDVLLIKDGAMTGSVATNNLEEQFSLLSSVALIKQARLGVNGEYLKYYLRSPVGFDEVTGRMSGSAIRRTTLTKIRETPIALPPLEEQRHIVATVARLMDECDALEARQQAAERVRIRCTEAVTHALRTADTPDAVATAWRRLRDHFDALCATPDDVDAVRQTILQLAVQGKLTAQDPSDEPADKLLERIEAEKQRLYKEGRIGKPKNLPEVESNEIPIGHVLKNWSVARMGEVILDIQTGPFGSTLKKSEYVEGEFPVINPSNLKHGVIRPNPSKTVNNSTRQRLSTYQMHAGDIVIGRRGKMGRCAVVTKREDGWICGTGCFILRLNEDIYSEFLTRVIRSPVLIETLQDDSVGSTMSNLNQGILNNLPVLLPPLAEQRRIVATVDRLVAVCDTLAAQLARRQATGGALLDAVLHAAAHDEAAPALIEA